jgi:molybdopterin-guanine dinucleotide biosynthesis protein A
VIQITEPGPAVVVAGAVLTGGASTRMGTDKALFEVDGTPMAVRVAAALHAVGCRPVALIGGDPAGLGRLGESLVPDVAPGEGPAGGIMSALRALGGTATWVLIASCDLAYLTPSQLLPLLAAVGPDGRAAGDLDVVVATTDHIQPLCALWRSTTSARVDDAFAAGVRSVFGLLDGLQVLEVPVEPDGLRNVNRTADLRAEPR